MPGAVTTWFNDIAGAAGWVPDFSQLPADAGEAPHYMAYNALNVRAMAAGAQFNDPYTDALTTKMSSLTYPATSSLGFAMGYSGGGPRISQPWGGNKYTIFFHSRADDSGWLVDYQLGVGLINGSERAAPAMANIGTGFVFSNDPATPKICYYLDSSRNLRRYDTDAMALAETGTNFPVANQGSEWLTVDENDDWFVSLYPSTETVCMHRESTNTDQSKVVSNINEQYVDKTGTFVYCNLNTDSGRIITLATNALGADLGLTGANLTFHSAPLRNHITGEDVSTGGGTTPLFYRNSAGARTNIMTLAYYAPDYHDNGSYLSQGEAGDQQYYAKGFGSADSWDNPGTIIFVRLDGGDIRTLCHQYTDRYSGGDYWNQTFPNWSPDGLLVAYSSDMNATADGDPTAVFVIEVPRMAA